jgi:hypothetical protein
MSYYFARVNANNIVTEVVVIGTRNCVDYLGNVSEPLGQEFCVKEFGCVDGERWIRTAKIEAIRGKYAGINDEYDEVNDRFLPPRPFGAWIFNETTYQYDPPHPAPELTEQQIEDVCAYIWDDNEYIMDNSNGWILVGGN